MKKVITILLTLILITLIVIAGLLYKSTQTQDQPYQSQNLEQQNTQPVTPEPNNELMTEEPTDTNKPDTSDTGNIVAITTGTVTGKICYPSEGIPPLALYLKEVETGVVLTQNTPANTGTYIFANVLEGSYVAFAYALQYDAGGAYTNAVPCGLTVSCTDHSLIEIKVNAGKTVNNVDLCDWYGDQVPSKP